jgi:DNA-binding NtrC family response regulator
VTHKETILLVDDEPTVRSALAGLLQDLGYRCIVAANAVDAVLIIEANLFTLDLLVTDVRMPGEIDGVDLANMVRQRQSDVAVLLITGNASAGSLARAESLGYRLLEKPFRHHQLQAVVAEELARRRKQTGGGGAEGGAVIPIARARDRDRG